MTLPESPVQDTDRLREVVARTQWYRDRLSGDGLGEWDDAHESDRREYLADADADAVLAAALPVHREMVLGEAANAIEDIALDTVSGWEAAEIVRRLAASTPPTPPSATESAERATAGPEEAPTPQEPSGAAYRTGRKVGRTIYRDDVLIGVMDTPELAALAVAAMNRAVPGGDDPWRRRIDVSTLYGYELGAGDLAGVEAELIAACRERDRLAETIRRYEPVIEAAKVWLAYGWNGSARLSAAIRALGDIPSPIAPEAAPVEPEGTPDA